MEGLLLEEEIEITRELMIDTVSKKGLGASETIKLSVKLDALMNQYEMHVSGKLPNDIQARSYGQIT